MGIFTFSNNHKEQELQNELDSINIQLTQSRTEIINLKAKLKEESQDKAQIQEELEKQNDILDKLIEQREEVRFELEKLQQENITLLGKLEKLFKKISKKDEKIKYEQELKSKYKFYFEHGAVDFTKAIALFNDLTNNNLSETKVRTYLVQNNIIYKAGRYYAPTPYAEDFNYVVVYGEHGDTAPKYTFEFIKYLKQMVDEKQI